MRDEPFLILRRVSTRHSICSVTIENPACVRASWLFHETAGKPRCRLFLLMNNSRVHVSFGLLAFIGITFTLLLDRPAAFGQGLPLQIGIEQKDSANNSNLSAFLIWDAVPDEVYQVQSASNLASATWKTEQPVKAGSIGPIKWIAPESLGNQKFYRLALPQPQIFSIEPASFASGTTVDIYLLGQAFSSNQVVRLNGVDQKNVLLLSPTLLRITVVPQTPGTYEFELVVAGSIVSTFPVQVFDATSLPAVLLQEPPENPPGSPLTTAKRGYGSGHYGIELDGGRKYSYTWSVDSQPPEVRAFSGEVQVHALDLFIAGRGLDLVWSRTYRSRTGSNTVMGNRWDVSYNIHCSQNGPNIDVCDGSGRCDTMFLQANGTFARDELFREGSLSNNVFRLTFADTGFWEFKPFDGTVTAGKIGRSVDRNSNQLTFSYDISGRLSQIVDTLGRTNTIAYNAAGQIQSFTDFSGRAITYAYYGNGDLDGDATDLKSVTTPPVTGTPNTNDFPLGKTMVYKYSKSFADDRENHLLLSVTDPKGQATYKHVYQHNQTDLEFLRCVSQQQGNTNEILTYAYVPQTPAPSDHFAVMRVIVNDRSGNVSEYFYDSRNRLVSLREFTGRAVPGVKTTDISNRPAGPLRSSDPAYFETLWLWNNDSLCTRVVYPGSNSLEFVYERDYDKNANPRIKGNLRALSRHRPTMADPFPDPPNCFYEQDPRFGCDPTARQGWDGTIKGNAFAEMAFARGPRQTISLDSSWSPRSNLRGWDGTIKGPTFDDGFVTKCVDSRGNATTGSYDSHGNLTQIVFPTANAVFDFTYNGFGQLAAVTNVPDANGYRRVDVATYYNSGPQSGYLATWTVDTTGPVVTISSYNYDAAGNIIRCVDPRGNDTLYSYNSLNQLVRMQSPTNMTTRCVTDYYYDANDNVIQSAVEVRDDTDTKLGSKATFCEYDVLNCPTHVTEQIDNSRNAVTEYVYDANRNLILARHPEAVNGHDAFDVVSYQYDERNLLFRTIRAAGSPIQSSAQFDYNRNGECVLSYSGLEDVTGIRTNRYTYDGLDRCVAMQDPMGNIRTNILDANANVVFSQTLGETNDLLGASGNRRLAETACQYDSLDRCARCVDSFFDIFTDLKIGSGQSVSTFSYAPNSQLISMTNPRGAITRYTFDTQGRMASCIDARSNVVAYTYDLNGNVTQLAQTNQSDIGSALVFTTSYRYDNLNRCVSSADNVGNTNRCAYDSLSRMIRSTDPKGQNAFYTYDLLGRCGIIVVDMDGDSLPNIADITTTQTWDDDSRLIARSDANNNPTQYSYDSLDRCVLTVNADGTQTTNHYDVHGELAWMRDANGSQVTFTYDLLGRCTQKSVLPGPGVASTTTFEQYAYDGCSRLVLASNDASGVTFKYDSLGNLVGAGENGMASTCTYDEAGNRLSLSYPGGRALSYQYDAINRCTNIMELGTSLASFAYELRSGPPSRTIYLNNARTRRFFSGSLGTPNPAGDFGWQQINHIRHANNANSAIDDRTFAWDRDGNKTARTLIAPFFAGGPTNVMSFAYDAANRLGHAMVAVNGGTTRDTIYGLDHAGNRTNVVGGLCSGPYVMDSKSPVPADAQMNQYTSTGCDSRQYDDNGTLVAQTSLSAIRSYSYDYMNRLVAVTDATNGPVAAYGYDALDRRISKTLFQNGLPPVVTSFFHNGFNVIEERNGANVVQATYVHKGEVCDDGNNRRFTWTQVSGPLAMTRAGQQYFFHEDDLGNTIALSDSAARVVERYEYDDFGALQFLTSDGVPTGATQSAVGNPYLLGGFRWDAECAYNFYEGWPCYLDSGSGRYISRPHCSDGSGFDGQAATAFADNNPWSASGSTCRRDGLVCSTTHPRTVPTTLTMQGVLRPSLLSGHKIIHRDLAARNFYFGHSQGSNVGIPGIAIEEPGMHLAGIAIDESGVRVAGIAIDDPGVNGNFVGIAIDDPGVNGNFAGIAIDEQGVHAAGIAIGDPGVNGNFSGLAIGDPGVNGHNRGITIDEPGMHVARIAIDESGVHRTKGAAMHRPPTAILTWGTGMAFRSGGASGGLCLRRVICPTEDSGSAKPPR